MSSLHTKYRPRKLEEVFGQDAAVRSMQGMIERKRIQTWLLTGPSGCGKTTLARIAAKMLGVSKSNFTEVDAATNSGIDAMRQIQELTNYMPLHGGGTRALLIDECHGLSAAAWKSILKTTEEPAAHVFWFLCTTEPGKVPPTIKTRFARIDLKPVDNEELHELLKAVCKAEGIKLASGVADVVVKEAGGSPRQLLVNLETAQDAEDRAEAAKMLHSAQDNDAVRELCQFITNGGNWVKATAILKRLEGERPESVRIIICNYLAAVLKNTNSDKKAMPLLYALEQFSTPFNESENMAPLVLAIGRICFGED